MAISPTYPNATSAPLSSSNNTIGNGGAFQDRVRDAIGSVVQLGVRIAALSTSNCQPAGKAESDLHEAIRNR
jgi:hypothetical protein